VTNAALNDVRTCRPAGAGNDRNSGFGERPEWTESTRAERGELRELWEDAVPAERSRLLNAGTVLDNGTDRRDCLSHAITKDCAKRRLRSLPDRLRQILSYEIGGVCLISPLFAAVSGASSRQSAGLLGVLALVMAAWNGACTTAFDWAERAIIGRAADDRPLFLRAAQAVMLELGGVVATTPVIAAWTTVTWRAALLEDVGLTLAYAAYAFGFGIGYDSLFPIDSEWAVRGGRQS
jgi:uncharacterized membrane protein